MAGLYAAALTEPPGVLVRASAIMTSMALASLVETAALAERLGDATVRVVDVRWYLDPSRRGREAYLAGHIPGAVFLDIDADLSAPGGGRGLPSGRHPWPMAEQVAEVMGRSGIGAGTSVVAYDDQ